MDDDECDLGGRPHHCFSLHSRHFSVCDQPADLGHHISCQPTRFDLVAGTLVQPSSGSWNEHHESCFCFVFWLRPYGLTYSMPKLHCGRSKPGAVLRPPSTNACAPCAPGQALLSTMAGPRSCHTQPVRGGLEGVSR